MKVLNSFVFVLATAGALAGTLVGCGSSSPATTGTVVTSPVYAAGEIAPVGGVCPAGYYMEPDGGCGTTYEGTTTMSTTSSNCSLYSTVNGCCPTSYSLTSGTEGNGVCSPSSAYSCITGTTVTSTYGCQPSTMPSGCSWSSYYNGCVGAGTPTVTSYSGWTYYPISNNQYVWYYTAGAPQTGCYWTGYGWACNGYYYWNGYEWMYL